MIKMQAVLFFQVLLPLTTIASGMLEEQSTCPKHQAFFHSALATYNMDLRNTVELWATLIPAPWEDNRVMGGLSNTSILKFSLTSTLEPLEQKGVIARNATATITQKSNAARQRQTGEAKFYIRSYAEDQNCQQMSMETRIVVGCPPYTRIKIRGRHESGCEDYANYTYTISRNELSPYKNTTAEKVVHYDYKRYGCPFQANLDELFRPAVDMYVNGKFNKEVQEDYILWEENGRLGFTYSATHRNAGCFVQGTTWHKALQSQQKPDYQTAWTKDNHKSCFKQSTTDTDQDLDVPYEVLNNTGVSKLLWLKTGLYIFQLRVIDPDASFCDLTTTFAVHVHDRDIISKVVPTFLVLGSSCVTILVIIISAFYFTSVLTC